MLNPPKTLEEAKKKVYGRWAGNPKGFKYRTDKCAYEVRPNVGWTCYQCTRKNGHGPNELYCKQHAKMMEKD